jgi:hypothetical protein
MVLFKEKGLPVIVKDLTNMVHYSSCNSAMAIQFLHTLVRVDPDNYNLDRTIIYLSSSIWKRGNQIYTTGELADLTMKLGMTECVKAKVDQNHPGYWEVYAYIFSLLPYIIWRHRVHGTRWALNEYQQLENSCFELWCKSHTREEDSLIINEYRLMWNAAQSWFFKGSQLTEANERCRNTAVMRIVKAFPSLKTPLQIKSFEIMVQKILEQLIPSLKSELRTYWMWGRGFLSWDDGPLPYSVDPDAYEKWVKEMTEKGTLRLKE